LIYACKDGDGIVVNDNKIEFVGNIVKIENGIVMTPEESF
jgi:dipeptidase E